MSRTQILPLTLEDYLEALARQTAKMSYPGSMSRGKRPIVIAGAKQLIEDWFCASLLTNELWERPERLTDRYADWHAEQARALGRRLRDAKKLGLNKTDQPPRPANEPTTVAAKFIDTFMHQLMKVEQLRPLNQMLHLPLDRRVLENLTRYESDAAARIKRLVRGRAPYTLPYKDYAAIQIQLWDFLKEFNDRDPAVPLTSRIDLNFLWL